MSGQPMIFPFVQYSLIFNIHGLHDLAPNVFFQHQLIKIPRQLDWIDHLLFLRSDNRSLEENG